MAGWWNACVQPGQLFMQLCSFHRKLPCLVAAAPLRWTDCRGGAVVAAGFSRLPLTLTWLQEHLDLGSERPLRIALAQRLETRAVSVGWACPGEVGQEDGVLGLNLHPSYPAPRLVGVLRHLCP